MIHKPDNKTSPTYTIAELAREFDITNRAIRFYEDQGLLYPARNGQQRLYSPGDRTLLKLILRGKRLGFSLAESKKLFDLYDPDTDNKHNWKHAGHDRRKNVDPEPAAKGY